MMDQGACCIREGLRSWQNERFLEVSCMHPSRPDGNTSPDAAMASD